MNFTAEQTRIIEAARPIWEGYKKSLTMNTGQREIADLRAVYSETFGQSGKYPEWSNGCMACVANCINLIMSESQQEVIEAPKADKPKKGRKSKAIEAATIADDEQK